MRRWLWFNFRLGRVRVFGGWRLSRRGQKWVSILAFVLALRFFTLGLCPPQPAYASAGVPVPPPSAAASAHLSLGSGFAAAGAAALLTPVVPYIIVAGTISCVVCYIASEVTDQPSDKPSESSEKDYILDEEVFKDHILERHGPESKYGGKGKFHANFNIKEGIDDAVTGEDSVQKPNAPDSTGKPRSGTIFEKTYNKQIGIDNKGKPAHTIRVVLDPKGKVITAFPIK